MRNLIAHDFDGVQDVLVEHLLGRLYSAKHTTRSRERERGASGQTSRGGRCPLTGIVLEGRVEARHLGLELAHELRPALQKGERGR